ncbi:MAG: 50S ribosomal protein L11 methyltransferase [Peptoniphilus sp.]|nr:50S ribosomal protein L11 methyltransferase [Peptoniphilus sp.]MDY3118872.1 50S ribosomal protein L11 methyltransferase [Peptoniphilus sp.]
MTHYRVLTLRGEKNRQDEGEMLFQSMGVDSYEVISADAIDALKEEAFIWDCIDESLLSCDGDHFELKAYFEEGQTEEMQSLENASKALGFHTTVGEVVDQDWANDWKRYFHPIAIDEGLSIVPSWETYEARAGERILRLDPGMAFGSGNHATSFLCALYLRHYVKKGDEVIDIGCGSGILSLVAVASGAERVIAGDLDPQCIQATKENAAKNHMDDVIDVRLGDLFQVVHEKADVVVSNIFAEVIIGMARDVRDHVKEGGIYIASGILKEKLGDVTAALEGSGFQILDTKTDGDWSAVAARRVH